MPSRRAKGRWAWAALLSGCLGVFVVAFVWVRTANPRLPAHQAIPFTDVNPWGANFFLDREVELWKQERTLQMARAAGIAWIKQEFAWEEIEPRRKGELDWAKFDRIVDLADSFDMQIIARLDRPPDWTRTDSRFKTRPPDNLADYGDFVYEFVHHYQGRVRFVQIWNEPNLSSEWGFQRVDAVAYTRLLQVAYRRAKEADPNVVVLSAPLAATLEDASMRGNHNDLIFLEQMYQAGAGGSFDILSSNAFGLGQPPEDPPDPRVLNFRRVELQRAIMERYGDAGKPIWLNEYGWNAAPDSFPEELLTWKRVTPEQQADYALRGIAWGREHWPWLGVVNIWYFRQVGDVPPDRAAYYFALVDPEFNPQRVYDAVRAAAGPQAVASSGLHQDTDRAVSAPGWKLVLDPEASAGSVLTGEEGAGSLSFTFIGSEVWLVTARGPDQGRLTVQVDGHPASSLRRDGASATLIDMRAGRTTKQVLERLARDLGAGPHSLKLTPEDPGQVTVDGFVVVVERSHLPFSVLLAMFGALAIAGSLLSGRSLLNRRRTD